MERLPVTAVARPAIVVVLAVLAAATLYDLTGKKPCLADHLVQQNHTTVAPSPGNKTFQDHSAGMRVILLGTGTPMPNPLRSGPATAVLAGGQAYLVDCGPGVVRRAAAAVQRGIFELDMRLLTRAFITHLHSDHTAGYADLIMTPAVVARTEPLNVYGPPGIKEMTENILAAYKEDLAVRAKGENLIRMRGYKVEVHEVTPGIIYEDQNIKVTAFAVSHGVWKYAYGYRFDTPHRSIVISGDTGPVETIIKACNGCDVLVHEVYCKAGFDLGPRSWQHYHATHHTSSVELAELASRARPKLLVLNHQLFFGCSEDQLLSEICGRYKGRVVSGKDLEVY
jgi:ribonuclease Z